MNQNGDNDDFLCIIHKCLAFVSPIKPVSIPSNPSKPVIYGHFSLPNWETVASETMTYSEVSQTDSEMMREPAYLVADRCAISGTVLTEASNPVLGAHPACSFHALLRSPGIFSAFPQPVSIQASRTTLANLVPPPGSGPAEHARPELPHPASFRSAICKSSTWKRAWLTTGEPLAVRYPFFLHLNIHFVMPFAKYSSYTIRVKREPKPDPVKPRPPTPRRLYFTELAVLLVHINIYKLRSYKFANK